MWSEYVTVGFPLCFVFDISLYLVVAWKTSWRWAVFHWGQFMDQISAYSSHAVVRDSFLSQKAGRWKKSKPIRALNCSQNICVRFLQLYTSWIKPLCFGTYSRNYLYKPLTYPFPCCNFISRALISTRACGKTLRSQRNGFKDKKCTSSKRFDLKNVHDLRTQWLSEQNYKQVLNLVYRALD